MKKIFFLVIAISSFGFSAFRVNYKVIPLQSKSLKLDTVKVDSTTGFIIAEGMEMVQAHCTGCHSNKVVTQYRATRENWLDRIRWMQKNHNLWQLGEAEPIVLDYLAKNYPPRPVQSNRRQPLKNIQWYRLNE